ncbi:hypothetical protein LTS18_008796, partial [Coniosporium uncinatum]
NKGHEVMVYLSYIIDNYENLPDINIFLHAHRFSWHNNELLTDGPPSHNPTNPFGDAVQMISRLSNERVTREGYMNLRCHWDPGCPVWLQPNSTELELAKQEQQLIGQAWVELFPFDPIPDELSQPCCAQFALSAERIRQVPLGRYVWMRDWMLRTELTDYVSGRVFEYTWQYIFTGRSTVCPSMYQCYCDGYGVCFKGEREFDKWFEIRYYRNQAQLKLDHWHEVAQQVEVLKNDGNEAALAEMQRPNEEEKEALEKEIELLEAELAVRKKAAMERGKHARIRAAESGREWHEGDGF